MEQGTKRKKPVKTNHALHITACMVMVGLAVVAAFCSNMVRNSYTANASSVNVAAFLRDVSPGAAHEAVPYGVPSNYIWQKRASMGNELALKPSPAAADYMNMWGQLLTHDADVQPANTRVEIANCQLWGYASGTWKTLLTASGDDMQAGSWTYDYKDADDLTPPGTLWPGKDGAVSLVTNPGRLTTFWNGGPEWRVKVGADTTQFISACSARLTLADATQPDDRAQAKYLIGMGADWRKQDGSCAPEIGETEPVCKSMGAGKLVKVNNEWRRVVFSTLSSSDLQDAGMLPPAMALTNPDGTSR